MTGTELRARRERLQLTHEQLSDRVGDHPEELRGYETISGRLPGALTRRLEWILAHEERAQLLRAEGVDECAWINAHFQGLDLGNRKAVEARLASANLHAAECPLCRRRAELLSSLPPVPPPPLSAGAAAFAAVAGRLHALPRWARPAAVGALLLGGMTALRVLIVRGLSLSVHELVAVLGAIVLGGYGGLVGGVAYMLVRHRTRPWGTAGHYATGVVCTYACLLAVALPLALWGAPLFDTPAGWTMFAGVATLLGIVVGHQLRRADRAGGAAAST